MWCGVIIYISFVIKVNTIQCDTHVIDKRWNIGKKLNGKFPYIFSYLFNDEEKKVTYTFFNNNNNALHFLKQTFLIQKRLWFDGYWRFRS